MSSIPRPVRPKKDPLETGRQMVEAMRREAKTFEDKARAFNAWVKLQQLESARKRGSMGSGFDQGGDDDDERGDL